MNEVCAKVENLLDYRTIRKRTQSNTCFLYLPSKRDHAELVVSILRDQYGAEDDKYVVEGNELVSEDWNEFVWGKINNNCRISFFDYQQDGNQNSTSDSLRIECNN